MNSTSISNSGGAANHAGVSYQDRVAAWLAVHILAEQEAAPLWEWPAASTLQFIRCNTEQPTDDVLVGTSHQGLAFLNVKISIDAGRSEDSDFASVLAQFVRQFITNAERSGTRPWERPLNGQRDRFVLVAKSATAPLSKTLPVMLQRARTLLDTQPLNDIAKTNAERDLLDIVLTHLRHAWQTRSVTELTEAQLIALLSLIRIQVLDVDENGAQEREAKTMLRTSVLERPEQADAAWAILCQTCMKWAKHRDGGARADLHQTLQQADIAIRAPRSYRADIERLRQHSEQTYKLLRRYSLIEMSGREIKMERPVSAALHTAAETHSTVVVGEPGAGKSGALHDLVRQLRDERDVIFLAVDKLNAQSLPELQQELGLSHPLNEVLQNWHGTPAGLLVIDALDAARSAPKTQAIYDLLSLLQKQAPRWHVIASIRQYDLRHHGKLQALFRGQSPSAFRSPEFPNLRHVHVARLGGEEWLQLATQAPLLGALYVAADAKLRDLLHSPFNVKLAAELLDEGLTVERLAPIRTQIELLDLYWQERVEQPLTEKDAREFLLTRAVTAMAEARSIYAPRNQIIMAATDGPILNDLLSANVLAEWQPSAGGQVNKVVLTFAHHVLFDYAAARLLLRDAPSLVTLLEVSPELNIALRPSLVMHFEHLRAQDVNAFWRLNFEIAKAPRIPEIGKLIGPAVAVEYATDLEEFTPLLHALNAADATQRECAERALLHVTGALLVKGTAEPHLIVGDAALNWSELLNRCSATPRATTVYPARGVLHSLCDHMEKLTNDQRQSAGIVARRLLEFALSQSQRDLSLVISGLETVCRTYESNAAASGALLRRCLEPSHVMQYGHQELRWIGNHVERLSTLDPSLVEELYRVAFTVIDTSDEQTDMGGSRILAMRSTRRQDYQSACYKLASDFGKFLHHAFTHAIRALNTALEVYSNHRYSYWGAESFPEQTFDLFGRIVKLKADRSEAWDTGGYSSHDSPVRMLMIFQQRVEQLCELEAADRQPLIEAIVQEIRSAALWRMLLKVAIHHPQTLGLELRSLCWALPILACDDTSQPVGELLKAIFPSLTTDERQRVETAVLSLANTMEDENKRSHAERQRNRLLGCLDYTSLVTSEVQRIVTALREADDLPPNEPRFPPIQITSGIPTDAENLLDAGVPIEDTPNQQIISLMEPVKIFAARFTNESPSLTEVEGITPALRKLHAALSALVVENCHQDTHNLAWSELADACASVSNCNEFSGETKEAEFIKTTLLEASRHAQPNPEAGNSHFDKFPTWSKSARINAANGLMSLANKPSCFDASLAEAIERLAKDPASSVRFQIARRLVALYHTTPALMWSLLEHFSRHETSRGVLQFLVHTSLAQLVHHHPTEIARLLHLIVDRIREGPGAEEVRSRSANLLVVLFVRHDQPLCRATIAVIADDPIHYDTEAHEIIQNLRAWLNLGLVEPVENEKEEVRHRSFGLLHQILSSILRQTNELEAANANVPFSSWGEVDQERLRDLARLADSIGMQVYFASGAYQDGNVEETISRTTPERTRFWRESRSTLELLSEFGYPSLTHHLLETLEYLIPYDPVEVFLLASRVVKKGKEGGYQYESMAIELIVHLVEQFIAEYAHHLQTNPACLRALMDILDTFVNWPAARSLSYRMHEIFR